MTRTLAEFQYLAVLLLDAALEAAARASHWSGTESRAHNRLRAQQSTRQSLLLVTCSIEPWQPAAVQPHSALSAKATDRIRLLFIPHAVN